VNNQDRQEISGVQKNLGYLTAKVEDLETGLSSLNYTCSQLRDTLEEIRDDISLAKATLRVTKIIGASVAALLVFNFKAFFVIMKGMF